MVTCGNHRKASRSEKLILHLAGVERISFHIGRLDFVSDVVVVVVVVVVVYE